MIVNPAPILSICIATYNRADYISETLESIVCQLTENVELIIVDGASTDNTSEIVQKYVDTYSQIRYIKLAKKGGVDQDYDLSVKFASGRMCWLFTDDDILKPNAIKEVLFKIDENYSLIIVNAELFDKSLTRDIGGRLVQKSDNIIFKPYEIDKLFECVISYISFIGCVIIDRELWNNRQKKVYYGTEFIHVGVIFQDFIPRDTLFIANPYIKIRYGNAQWSTRAFQIGMSKWPNLISTFNIISENTRNKVNFKRLKRWLVTIILFRAKGNFGFKEFRNWEEQKSLSFLRRIIVILLLFTPGVLINFLILSYMKFFRIDKNITIYDLESSTNNIMYCRFK
jgi:glycosyltransferase involved in cell wall biosynthesis